MSPPNSDEKKAASQHQQPEKSSKQPENEHNGSYKPADRELAIEYVKNLQATKKATDSAAALREQASKITDAKERKRVLNDAYNKEMEARGLSKVVKRTQSGPWQGLFAGAGIGGAISAAIGTLIGTLVGGALSIPTMGLGALVGTGVGAVHGPFIKIGGVKKSWEQAEPEDVVQVLEQEQKQNQNTEKGEERNESHHTPERRKPRKLEVRSSRNKGESNPSTSRGNSTTSQTAEQKRLRKLERIPYAQA
jgi:hypothetical protein